MNLRIALSLVSVASLAYACGPRARTDAALNAGVAQQGFAIASMGGARAPKAKTTSEKTLKSDSSALDATFGVAQNGDEVVFQFRVVNASARRVEVTFPSGQAYDFVVVDSIGREVWRWADGRIFTQSVQNKLLAKGEGLTITEKWIAPKSGRFTAVAQLRSRNFPLEERVVFEHR